MNNLKRLSVMYCLLGMGLLSGSAAVPAWGAVPNINNIDGQTAWGGTTIIYIDQTTNITIDGNNAGSFKTVTIIVNGANVAFTTSNNLGNFNSTFNTAAATSFKSVRVRAQSTTSAGQRILVDVTPPNTPVIRWRLPQDKKCMASTLSRIYTNAVSDLGGSGIDWSRCYITVSSVSGSTSDSGGVLDFVPTNDYPNAGSGHDFDAGTTHNLYARVYDRAGNYASASDNFCFNGDAPDPRIQWRHPDRGYPPSYYMGQGLNRIWADWGCSSCAPDNIINYSASTMSVNPLPIPNAGSKLNGDGLIEWQINTPPLYHTNFTNGQLYTVTVNLIDIHGVSGTDTRQFMKDENCPVITNVRVINALMNPVDLTLNHIVMRGSQMRTPYYFVSDITDSPADWGGHTSLNGAGISYSSYYPSRINIYEEDAGSVSGNLNYMVVGMGGQNYQGRLTVPATHSPESGVHWLRNWARDWAYYGNVDHEDYNEGRFLVDDIPPQEDHVQLPVVPLDLITPGAFYLKTYNLTTYPRNISVAAQDQPANRGYNFEDRLNLTASTVYLRNPDNNLRDLTSNNNWQRLGSDLSNVFDADIIETDPPPIFPYPEFGGNTIEGRYTIKIHLEDKITPNFGLSNKRDADYYFYNDVSLPHLASWTPFFSTQPIPGIFSTSSFSHVQATVIDPDLRDGWPGSGLDLDACAVKIYLGLHKTAVTASGSGGIILPGPFVGHQSQPLDGETAEIFRINDIDQAIRGYHGWTEIEYPLIRQRFIFKTSAIIDPENGVVVVSGLTPGESYKVGWEINSIRAPNSTDTFGAIPVTTVNN
ncbi:hypothetical protein KAR10_07180, partial [bacterium]|nr:hypothetical protein [bacterium]